jgi:hypothetical protein
MSPEEHASHAAGPEPAHSPGAAHSPGMSPEEHASHAGAHGPAAGPEEAVYMPAKADSMCHWTYGKCTLSKPFFAAKVGAPAFWGTCTEKNIANAPHAKGWDCGMHRKKRMQPACTWAVLSDCLRTLSTCTPVVTLFRSLED